jgi:single-strand DNA-binding protein
MYLNKALIIGNLTEDPELRSLPSGTPVTNFSIATNRTFTDNDGQQQERTNYHNIVVFGRQAETVAQYLSKGSMALVEGRLQTRSWEQDGVTRYRTEIVANRVQFGPRSGNSSGGGQGSQKQAPPQQNQSNQVRDDEDADTIDYPDEDIDPDDIPF